MTEQTKLQQFLNKLNKVKQTGPGQWQARCPAHDDQIESLSVSLGQDKINFWCHAGCSGDEILNAINLSWSDIYFDEQKKEKRKIVATYDYNDKNGDLLFQVVRFKPKTFRQRRPDGNGGWNWGLGDIKPVLYKLPEVIEAVQNNNIIWLVEGEKDADNLMKLGFTATTAPMGAGKWKDRYTKTLAGGKIIILPDNDKAGKKHAKNVARALSLYGKAKVKILELPGLDKKGDVSDWLDNGGTKKELLKLAKDCPTYKPDSQQGERQRQFEEFLPTPIAQEIIKQEEAKGRLWKYVAEKDLFYFYDTAGYWRNQEPQYLKKFIRQHLRQFDKKWDTNYRVNEVIAAMKSLLLDPENAKLFDAGQDPDLQHINLKNGMLDWRTGELKPHQPDYYSQFQLPVKYDPEADCPRWKQALKEWKPEKEARMVLQEFVGYCLIPDTSMQKAIILTGDGSNGKSTFLDILVELFGRSNLSSIPLQRLGDRFETANIQDKLINVAADIDPTYMKETGIVKTIIGGDKTLRGERKFGASFDFTPVARLIFSANEIPKTRDKTEAWYRRFQIIEFPNTFEKTDPNFDPDLKNKLKKELPGILNWAVEGLKILKDQKHFTESESIQEAKREYERANDTVVAFLEDKTKFPEDNYVIAQKVYEEYRHYCEKTGLKPTTRKTFTSKLKQLGFEVKNKWKEGKTRRCYYGLVI